MKKKNLIRKKIYKYKKIYIQVQVLLFPFVETIGKYKNKIISNLSKFTSPANEFLHKCRKIGKYKNVRKKNLLWKKIYKSS